MVVPEFVPHRVMSIEITPPDVLNGLSRARGIRWLTEVSQERIQRAIVIAVVVDVEYANETEIPLQLDGGQVGGVNGYLRPGGG